jgi:cysteine desulfurase
MAEETKREIYADNAATTQVSSHAFEEMLPYLKGEYGNPSGFYRVSRDAKRALEAAREKVAECINAKPAEVYFTGSGSESDNWAIRSTAEKLAGKGRHIITSAIEHHAIIYTMERLEKQGYDITRLPVDAQGRVNPEDLKASIRPDTILVSIMMANNEIGTIEPIKELAAIAHEHDILFHTDAVQAAGHIPVDVEDLGVDLLSMSGHKFHGPKGVGVMYMREGVNLPAFLIGGGQERGKRGSTENVAGIVGLATALEDSVAMIPRESARLAKMRDRLMDELIARIPYSRITGPREGRLPGTASLIFECIEGESMVLLLDQAGIAASSGSACSSGSLEPSHVLLAIGLVHELAHGSLRLSLSDQNTEEDVDYIIEVLPGIIARLRAMSPVWDEKNGKPEQGFMAA